MNLGALNRTMKTLSILSIFVGISVQGLSAKDRNDHQIKLTSFSLSDVSQTISETATVTPKGFRKAQKPTSLGVFNHEVANLIQMNDNSVFVKLRF